MALPILVSDAKAYLRVDGNDEDAVIQILVNGAFLAIERHCGLVAEKVERPFAFDVFTNQLLIPRHPVAPDTLTLAYANAQGEAVQIEDFRAITRWGWTMLLPADGAQWPIDVARGSIIVTAEVGHDVPTDYPDDALQAAYIVIATRFYNREAGGISADAAAFLGSYSMRRV